MSFYPPAIYSRCCDTTNAGSPDDANAEGTAASFVCGSFVTLLLQIDDAGALGDARFRTNGCGFMTASANVVCDWLKGKSVTDLHGLADADLFDVAFDSLVEFPPDRVQCAQVVFEALRKAMAVYREHRVQEFRGETALICTCFGVSEKTIVDVIESHRLRDVGEVSRVCRAGSGCGSCRMLIQELIDSHPHA